MWDAQLGYPYLRSDGSIKKTFKIYYVKCEFFKEDILSGWDLSERTNKYN